MSEIHVEPADCLLKLEYDKIIHLLVKEAMTPMAAQRLEALYPRADHAWIELRLREVRDYKLALEKNDRLPMRPFADLSEDLRMLRLEGFTLSPEAFQNILSVLYQIRDWIKFFAAGVKKEIYVQIYALLSQIHLDESLIQAINAVFDEKGELRPDASPELIRIRRDMQAKMRELDARFRQVINEYRQKGWLADSPESFRNNRRVLAVPAEHKRKIRGIIHDESDTGRTAFIEPDGIIEINNDIFDLENEEKREIFRILRNLSDAIRPFAEPLAGYQEILTHLDVIQAQARLAVSMRANIPQIKKMPAIAIRKGYHPLLYLKNKSLGRRTVPFDLRLTPEDHILILSGPNAGGKSVAMKSVGLLQLMLQSGLPVPVHEQSEFGIFTQFFADIGDQQSLDDDLSTYSSRLRNAKIFLEKATPQTLVLIDEMGSGTDPKPGGAIAEAVLRGLHRKGVFAVVTTHYSNLKVFAFRNSGLLNAHMHFDKDALAPTYELRVGKPGSSYAFEIAAKSGLKRDIIEYARKRAGSETAVDDILVELQREKQELEQTLNELREKEQNLDRLIKSYDSMHADLERKRKQLKLDQREFELRQTAQASREIEKLIKQLKQEKNLEAAQKASEQLREQRVEQAQKVDMANAELVKFEEEAAPSASARPLIPGDHVRLRSGGAIGKIQEIKGDKAKVIMGELTLSVALRDLIHAVAPTTYAQPAPSVNIEKAAQFENKIDLRGLSRIEALDALEKFVDNAMLSNAVNLRILHGKGDGVLRQMVRQKLKEYGRNIARIYHPEPRDGGDGVTVVEL
ncbi:MAG: endonuclease MutS2 [Saprospiraceae bacterium]